MEDDVVVVFSESQDNSAAANQSVDTTRPQAEAPFSWWTFVKEHKDKDIEIAERVSEEAEKIVVEFGRDIEKYCILFLYEPDDEIDRWDSNRILAALEAENPDKEKDVLLFLGSQGGRIEPAYQISKICKAFSKDKFVVTVSRAAKSAATLVALGADEIHMGMLGELGPIDPQIGDLPALGVKKAIETIASVCERYPRSAPAFADYMSRRITIEQIGYCERVSESAVQYAERLLSKKEETRGRAAVIAKQLVYTYKHHGFVIDVEEAHALLGSSWIFTGTLEMALSEKLYKLFDAVNLALSLAHDKHLLIVGSLKAGAMIIKNPSEG